jgi:hypothetical protein
MRAFLVLVLLLTSGCAADHKRWHESSTVQQSSHGVTGNEYRRAVKFAESNIPV